MREGVHIRPLKPEDIPAYLGLRAALWPEGGGDWEEVEGILSRGDQGAFVAEVVGAVVGFVEVGLRPYAEGCTTSPVGYLEGWMWLPHGEGGE